MPKATSLLRASLLIASLGALSSPGAALAQNCANTWPPLTRVNYDDTALALNIIGPSNLESNIEGAAGMWTTACAFSKMPGLFLFTAGTARGSNDARNNSILIVYTGQPAPVHPLTGQTLLAEWVPADNTILLYDKPDGTPIAWNDPFMRNTIAHEIGHALGLSHDGCPGGLMAESALIPTTATVDSSHCGMIEFTQDPVCGPTSGTSIAEGAKFRPRFCPTGCDCPNGFPNPDDPLDGLEPCDFLPTLCDDENPFPWYSGFLSVSCTTTIWNFDFGSYAEVTCREIWVYSSYGGKPAGSEANELDGTGPAITVTSFADGARVSGTLTIAGSSVASDYGTEAMAFWIDDQHVDLSGFAMNLLSAASCDHPAGGSDPNCPRVGFSGSFDTRTLSEGEHVLKVVAVDARKPYPRPTLLVRRFVVDNVCDDTQAPSVAITAPSAGATVTGTVSVTANAADNVGVASVQFLVDGSVAATDTTAPYSFAWNTAGASAGSHTLTAKALDACGNPKTSAPVGVTVAGIPDVGVFLNHNGVAVPRGGSVSLGSTPVGVATSLRFEIRNAGNGPLHLANPAALVSGTCFSQIEAPPATPVPAGGTSYFRVRLFCGSAGSYSGTVSIASDDPDESPYNFTVTGTVTAPAVPDIGVFLHHNGVAVPQGGSVSLGSTPVGVATSLRFEIRNAGNAALNLGNAASLVSGTCFSQIETPPVTPVPAGGTSYFRVRLFCGSAGGYSGTVSIASDDPDESPYSFTVSGSVTAPAVPDVGVFLHHNGVAVPQGGSVSLGSTPAGVATSLRFEIRNTGNAALNLGNAASLVSGACFSQIETPVSPVPVGGTSYFRVRLFCGSAGGYSGTVSIASDDPDESTYAFTVTGTVTTPSAPDVGVFLHHNGVAVPQGGSVSLGSTPVGVATSLRFEVRNTGNAALGLANAASLVSGACFSQIETPVTPVPVGGTSYFRVRLHCGSAGSFSGTVSIASDDPDESPYSFTVTGTVTN